LSFNRRQQNLLCFHSWLFSLHHMVDGVEAMAVVSIAIGPVATVCMQPMTSMDTMHSVDTMAIGTVHGADMARVGTVGQPGISFGLSLRLGFTLLPLCFHGFGSSGSSNRMWVVAVGIGPAVGGVGTSYSTGNSCSIIVGASCSMDEGVGVDCMGDSRYMVSVVVAIQ